MTHIHPAGAVPPRSGVYLLNVYSIVREQVRGFAPQVVDHEKGQKIKAPEKFLKITFISSSFGDSSLENRKTKKIQPPQ